MAYCLVKKEQLSFGLKRILLEEIDGALKELSDKSKNVDDEIHSARKHFKKIRALLKLIRCSIGEELYRNYNIIIRDSARNLAPSRNSAVIKKAFDNLSAKLKNADINDAAAVKEVLLSEYNNAKLNKTTSTKIIRDTRRVLKILRAEVHQLPLSGDDFLLVKDGVLTIYSGAKKHMASSEALISEYILHEWRKYIKHLWYTFRLFSNFWPAYFTAVSEELEKLSEILGEINDLAMLEEKITQLNIKSESVSVYIAEINRRKTKLVKSAFITGEKLFLERPKVFAGRMESLYLLWKKQTVRPDLQVF